MVREQALLYLSFANVLVTGEACVSTKRFPAVAQLSSWRITSLSIARCAMHFQKLRDFRHRSIVLID
jgi:hypothetical protein